MTSTTITIYIAPVFMIPVCPRMHMILPSYHQYACRFFDVHDTDDGKYETRRQLNLIRVGILNHTNAPGFSPPPCPSMDDPQWRYASHDDVDRINMWREMERWKDVFYNTYAETSGHLRKALVKVPSLLVCFCRVYMRQI